MRINILNKEGIISYVDRKEPLVHGGEFFTFSTCLDLSKPIELTPYGNRIEYSLQEYSRDLMNFISWWNYFVAKDLNDFSGFHNVEIKLIGFKVI